MEKIIGVKELRENLETYSNQVQKGKTFVVVRRSKPLFKISPVDDDGLWEPILDLSKIRKGGVPIKELLTRL